MMSNLNNFIKIKEWNGEFVSKNCNRALSISNLRGLDFALNPYSGCAHGCVYCYAPEVTHFDWKTWRIVKVKSNIATQLSKEVKYAKGSIGLGTSTDPYQYAESRFQITRDCLIVLKKAGNTVHIITKSDLVTRDIDILKDMNVTVGISFTHLDDRISKIVEPGAPLPEKRLSALKDLINSKITAYVMGEPLMSDIENREREYVETIASTGIEHLEAGGVNYRPMLHSRMKKMHLRSISNESLAIVINEAKKIGIHPTGMF